MSERRRWVVVAVGYAAVLLALNWRVLVRGQVCGWDCLDEYWPDLVFQSRALADGEWPLWNPYTLGGYPFYADPQAGVLTPVNWICTLISWVFGVGAYLIQVKVLLLFYSALVGMHVLVWRWTRSHAAAACASVTFAFGGPLLVHKNSALIWPLLLLPWALVAYDWFRALPTARRGLALGAATGMVIVTHPQGAFYCCIVIALYVAWDAGAVLLARLRARDARAALVAAARRFAPGLACALAVVIVWSLLVYLPTWTTVEDSARAERTLGWALSSPLTTHALRELFVPALDTNWMLDIYLGPLAIICMAWLAVADHRGRLWLVLAVLSVLLALGAAGHLLPWLATHVPGFGLFRIAYRYKLIAGFAAAAAIGQTVGLLATTDISRGHRNLLLGLTGLWLFVACTIARAFPPWPALLVIAALVGCVLDRAQRRGWWLAALVLCVLVDLWRAGDLKLSILQTRPPTDRGAELIAKMPGVDRDWRYHASRHSGSGGMLAVPYHASNVHGIREISGFEHPLVSQRVLDVLAAAERSPLVLTHFNTKYFLGAAPPLATRVAGTPLSVANDVAPVGRLYPAAELLPQREILARLTSVPPSALRAALVEPGAAPVPLPAADFAPIDATLVIRERARLVLEVDAPAAGVLVINEAWTPQWRARIDGAPAVLFRAHLLLRAVVVPAGKHRVEVELSAPLYTSTLVALPVLALVALAFAYWRSRRVTARRQAGYSGGS